MVRIEPFIFTRPMQALLSDEKFSQLQMALVLLPEKGVVIPDSDRLRKERWAFSSTWKTRRYAKHLPFGGLEQLNIDASDVREE
jgi:hypothetical protein